VPYIKGALFLTALEHAFGRQRFDTFLRNYFSRFAFQSVDTAHVVMFIRQRLFDRYPELGKGIDVDEWISAPGLPATAPLAVSDALMKIRWLAEQWSLGVIRADEFGAKAWTAHEWLYFLRSLPVPLTVEQMRELDSAFTLTEGRNPEIVQQWLLMAVRSGYATAYPRLREFLLTVGRRLFVKPLYEELVKTRDGEDFARSVYKEARTLYHPITRSAIDSIVNPPPRLD
jgi:leukotriene-A4 hydrolase